MRRLQGLLIEISDNCIFATVALLCSFVVLCIIICVATIAYLRAGGGAGRVATSSSSRGGNVFKAIRNAINRRSSASSSKPDEHTEAPDNDNVQASHTHGGGALSGSMGGSYKSYPVGGGVPYQTVNAQTVSQLRSTFMF